MWLEILKIDLTRSKELVGFRFLQVLSNLRLLTRHNHLVSVLIFYREEYVYINIFLNRTSCVNYYSSQREYYTTFLQFEH